MPDRVVEFPKGDGEGMFRVTVPECEQPRDGEKLGHGAKDNSEAAAGLSNMQGPTRPVVFPRAEGTRDRD